MNIREVTPVDWNLLALKILLTGILIVMLFMLCALLVARVRRTLAVKHTREHIVKLSNQGNFTSIFTLSVVTVEQMFDFKFLLNDIPLVAAPKPEVAQQSAEESATPPEPAAQSKPGKKEAAAGTAADKKTGPIDTAAKGGKAVAAKAGQAASFLGTLASLLPASIGGSLRAESESLRQTQTNAQSAAQAPVDAQRKVDALQQQGGRLTGGKPPAADGNPNPPTVSQPGANSSSASAAFKPGSSNAPAAVKKAAAPEVYKVQTQPVEPGAELSLVLRVETTKHSRPDGTYAYTLTSQQLSAEMLERRQPPPVVKQGILHYPHVNFWRYWLSPVVTALVIAVFLFASILTLRLIWY